MGLIRFAVKSGIAGGIIYLTVDQGLWSSPEDTINLYNKIYNSVAPLIQRNVPEDVAKSVPNIPNPSTLMNCAKGMWNRGVMTSIKFTSELPTHISNGIDSLMSTTALNESIKNVKGLVDAKPESGKQQ